MDTNRPNQVLAHCPLCQSAYRDTHIRLLSEKGAQRTFHCSCNACGHALMAVIVESAGTISSVGLVTDMELQDAVQFRDVEPISADECVSAYRSLRDNSRTFIQRLLDKKP